MSVWQLSRAVNLRAESFGGMLFHRERGITLEVDAEAYQFLCTCLTPRTLPLPNDPASHLIPQLIRLGFLQPAAVDYEQVGSGRGGLEQPSFAPTDGGLVLSAPETVHLAITTRCNQACPGCYVPQRAHPAELAVAELCGLIDQWAQMPVFQLAIGGGEPLLYEGLFEVLAHARKQGVVPSLTTNGLLINAQVVQRLEQVGVARVNVSWNGPGGEEHQRHQATIKALRLLLDSNFQVGVNVLVTPPVLPHLSDEFASLHALGVRHVTVLRPKPPALPSASNAMWYKTNRLAGADLSCLHGVMKSWRGTLALEIDSALVGLMNDIDPAILRWRGIYGCAAGRRICTVWPDGRVTPCSFLADLSAGNVRQTPFAELWKRGENWEILRDASPAARPGYCTGCTIAPQCGGARCVEQYEQHSNPGTCSLSVA
jgi:radical SAM protein with 4Fe4S-binding SPASM domain